MKVVLGILASLSLLSCSSFRYGTIASKVPSGADGSLSYENDSLRVSYIFKGEECPVTVRLYNKAEFRCMFIGTSPRL